MQRTPVTHANERLRTYALTCAFAQALRLVPPTTKRLDVLAPTSSGSSRGPHRDGALKRRPPPHGGNGTGATTSERAEHVTRDDERAPARRNHRSTREIITRRRWSGPDADHDSTASRPQAGRHEEHDESASGRTPSPPRQTTRDYRANGNRAEHLRVTETVSVLPETVGPFRLIHNGKRQISHKCSHQMASLS